MVGVRGEAPTKLNFRLQITNSRERQKSRGSRNRFSEAGRSVLPFFRESGSPDVVAARNGYHKRRPCSENWSFGVLSLFVEIDKVIDEQHSDRNSESDAISPRNRRTDD